MAFFRNHNGAVARNHCDLPRTVAADSVRSCIKSCMQCACSVTVRRFAPRDAIAILGCAYPIIPVPLLEHGGAQQAVRVPATNIARCHRCACQGAYDIRAHKLGPFVAPCLLLLLLWRAASQKSFNPLRRRASAARSVARCLSVSPVIVALVLRDGSYAASLFAMACCALDAASEHHSLPIRSFVDFGVCMSLDLSSYASLLCVCP